MIKEYAIEPDLLNNWKDFRFFISLFSIENGRAISGCPSPLEWKNLVRRATNNCKPVEKQKIIECLNQINLIDRGTSWNNRLPWIENVLNEDARKPFHAIISKRATNYPRIIRGDEVTYIHNLVKTSRTIIIKRKPKEMALCIKELLQNSRQFIFIDPYFLATATEARDPNDPRHRGNIRNIKRHIRPLKEFLELISKVNKDNTLPTTRLQYHSKNVRGCVDDNTFKSNCDYELPSLIPKDLYFELVRWEDESLHNRYILTDIGGVMFGTGLDDNDEGDTTKADKDVVTLLDENTRKQLWQQYVSKPPLHEVKGTK